MNKKIYMTTGEFARIMRITKETLFHYDEIGLFQPELTRQMVTAIIRSIRPRSLTPSFY